MWYSTPQTPRGGWARDHMFLPMNNRLEERWSHELAPAAAGGLGVWQSSPWLVRGRLRGERGGVWGKEKEVLVEEEMVVGGYFFHMLLTRTHCDQGAPPMFVQKVVDRSSGKFTRHVLQIMRLDASNDWWLLIINIYIYQVLCVCTHGIVITEQ